MTWAPTARSPVLEREIAPGVVVVVVVVVVVAVVVVFEAITAPS